MEGKRPLATLQHLCSDANTQQPLLPPTLVGEHLLLISKTTDGHAMVTNFRFSVYERQLVINIPLMAIGEMLVVETAKRLRIGCKDGSTYSCTFATAEDCQVCMSTLKAKTGPPQSPEDLFAYKFYAAAAATYKQSLKPSMTIFEEGMIALCQPVSPDFAFSLDKETERLGFETKGGQIWRISQANAKFELCPTYPKFHILPAAVDDDKLKVSLDYRALKRFPSVVWRDKRTGMVLIRSSQPLSSFLGVSYFTNHADVFLVEEIVAACNRDWSTLVSRERTKHSPVLQQAETSNNFSQGSGQRGNSHTSSAKDGVTPGSFISDGLAGTPGQEASDRNSSDRGDHFLPKKLAIVDCRSLAGMWGNSFKGGGTEDEAVYKCNVVHLDLANIHAVRDSFHKLMAMRHTYVEGMVSKNLTDCSWLSYISTLLRGANVVVELMHVVRRPVLVHCSDGWDRTSQIVSLSELLMDPFYRRIEGFQVLVEREWLHFGHKFGERGGHDPRCSDTNQMSPIFLQFLDCVHQLIRQNPDEFQFNEAYLMKLLQHSQACLFGNFLHNCQRERENCPQKTASVWSLLKPERKQFVNLLYQPADRVLVAKSNDVVLWKSVYMPGHTSLVSHTDFYQDFKLPAGDEGILSASTNGTHGLKSIDDLSRVKVDGHENNISQGLKIAATAASTDSQRIEPPVSEILHLPDGSTRFDSKTDLLGNSVNNIQDLSRESNTGSSHNCEHSFSSSDIKPASPKIILEASALKVIHEDHTAVTLNNLPADSLQSSSSKICLNEPKYEATSTDKDTRINEERDVLSGDDYSTHNLVSSSPGFLNQKNGIPLDRHQQLMCCDNPTTCSNLLSSEMTSNDTTAYCHIIRSKSLDSISSRGSNSQIFTLSNTSINSDYIPLHTCLLLGRVTDPTGTPSGFGEEIISANRVARLAHPNSESSLTLLKPHSQVTGKDTTRREFYRKLGIKSNRAVTTCFERPKADIERKAVGTGCDSGSALDSGELGDIIVTRTDLITGERTNVITGERTDAITGERTDGITGTRTDAITGERTDAITGTRIDAITGTRTYAITGTRTDVITGTRTDAITGTRTDAITGTRTDAITGTRTDVITGTRTDAITGTRTDAITGERTDAITGTRTDAITGTRTDAITGTTHASPNKMKGHPDLLEAGTELEEACRSLCQHREEQLPDLDAATESSDRLRLLKTVPSDSSPNPSVSQCTGCCCLSDLEPGDAAAEREDVSRRLLPATVTNGNRGSPFVQTADSAGKDPTPDDKPMNNVSGVSPPANNEPETTTKIQTAGCPVTHCSLCGSAYSIYQPEDVFRDRHGTCRQCCSSDQRASQSSEQPKGVCLGCHSQKRQGVSSDGRIPTLVVDV